MLANKKILLGITGSIAAYKCVELVRLFIKAGAEVRVVITPSAKDFVSPLVLSTLSRNKVYSEIFEKDNWNNHVMLGRWADVMIITPLSCNTLSKMATGECDNFLLAVYLSATCPVIVCPAMDEDMHKHASTKKNITILRERGNIVIDAESGELASGLFGEGRMPEPQAIFEYVNQFLHPAGPLSTKKVLITAGPTYEPIDPVRFLGNHSSGKMGFAMAEAFAEKGATVTLVSGPTHCVTVNKNIVLIRVTTAEEMYTECIKHFEQSDIAVMSAAVADFTPETVAEKKIKKDDKIFNLPLKKTADILKQLGTIKKPSQLLVGFALETNNEAANAKEKLRNKGADMIVLNSLRDVNAGFGYDTNKVTIFQADGQEHNFELQSKIKLAKQIVELVEKIYHV